MNSEDRLKMPLGEAIFSLRAIRKLKKDAILHDDLVTILEAAIKAPTGGNAQPWHFLVIRDADLRKQFAPLYHEAWWAKRRDSGYNSPEDLPDNYRSAMDLADEIGDAPILIFICAMARGRGRRQLDHSLGPKPASGGKSPRRRRHDHHTPPHCGGEGPPPLCHS